VDLRETLAQAAEAGVIDAALRDALVAAFKRRFYRARSFEALSEVLAELGVPSQAAQTLQAWLVQGRTSQKKADAAALLETLAAGGTALPTDSDGFIFERTTLWAQFIEQAEAGLPARSAAERGVLEELRLDPDLYASLRDIAVLRLRLVVVEPPPPADAGARRAALDRLRHRHGLWSREALEAWAEACDLDRAGLDRLLDFEAALETCAAGAGPALDSALLDVLRREGRYGPLAARARDKAQRLAGVEMVATAPSAPSPAMLLDWYFEGCLDRGVPTDLPAYAAELGFEGVEALLAALAREQRYRAVCDDPSTPGGA
jgi:hypothetical protein